MQDGKGETREQRSARELVERLREQEEEALQHFPAFYEDYLEEVTLAGMQLKSGDMVRIVLGRREFDGIFKAFNPRLMAITIETHEGEMLIPYRQIKYILKLRRNNGR